ncbi:helix-turn-helix domain-containing protein [Psychrobacter urativorans]|uniref:helix-turn-helix domain-containing protein n=1 Tax=Psychrobacter urativorans TaxID=45610 RepID=UPI003BB671B2
MTNPLSTNQSDAQGSFGAMLQQARQNKQVSLDEAAGELFILKRHLQALESESFSELPQAAFARGFAINYAKFLGLDPAKIASSFDSVYPNELKPRSMNNTESLLRPMGTLQRDDRSRIRFNPLLIIAAIALIVLAVFLFRMVTNAAKDEQQPAPVAEEITATEQTQGAALDGVDDSVGASGSALNLGAAATAADNASLQLKLTDAASVGVIDATGTSLISGEQTKGDYQLSGQPPFNIVIDNIDNVDLSLNQQPVALEQYATGKKASFALTP